MKQKLDIKPLVGLGDLKFGATKKDVEKAFGKPQETENIEVEDDLSDAQVWSYEEKGLSVFFENDFDELLTCFDTNNDDFTLFGKNVFDLKKDKIIELMKQNGYSDYESEDEDWGEHRLSFNDAVMDFYFDDQSLVSVSWGVMIDNNNKALWPE